MHQQSARQLQESLTSLSGAEVLDRAATFFAGTGGIYAAFPESRGPTHIVLRGQGGEEIAIGVRDIPEGTAVTGSTYLYDQQLARFLSGLPLPALTPVVGNP